VNEAVVRYVAIDHCLGRSGSRYFGQGFRRVGHNITDVLIEPAVTGGTISAKADVLYPIDWSTKTVTDAPRPHLSTVDALVIAVQLAEAHLAHTHGLDVEQRRRMWLRAFAMRAGTSPQEELTAIPASGSLLSTSPSLDGPRELVSQFQFRIGTIQLTCDVEHDAGTPTREPAGWADMNDLLGDPATRFYGDGFTRRQQSITDLEINVSSGAIRALMDISAPAGKSQAEPTGGFSAHYEPLLSMVDCLVVMAQLAQALMYDVDGVDRGETGTLWMRRIAMSCQTPFQPVANAFVATGQVVKSKRLDRPEASWRLFDLHGICQGIDITASLAFMAPLELAPAA
jgi:hypothetical protein